MVCIMTNCSDKVVDVYEFVDGLIQAQSFAVPLKSPDGTG